MSFSVLCRVWVSFFVFFFFQAEDGIRDLVRSRGLGDVYKRQVGEQGIDHDIRAGFHAVGHWRGHFVMHQILVLLLSLIHI